MRVILDTNFIIECVKNKVDIFDIENYGKILIPNEVIKEIEKITHITKEKIYAEVALRIIDNNKDRISFIELEKKYADMGIILFAEKNKDIAVATLDKELKRELAGKARILTLENRKKLILL